jgi:hypothetical protein
MTIEITKPEIEALINQRLQSGVFKDAEEVILQALQSSLPPTCEARPVKTLQQVFEAARGLGDGVEFIRNPSIGRRVDL